MAVIAFDEIHDGRDGAKERQGGKTVRTYTRVYRVKTDSNFDEAAEILTDSRCPILGTSYPYDTSCTCRSVRPRNEPFSKRVWIVTATYSNEREQPDQQQNENPLAEPARITWASEQFQRPYAEDKDGNAIVNAAGDPFTPQIEGDDSRWTCTIRKNVAAVPTWLLTYPDAVNDASFTVDGVSVNARCAKVQSIQIGEWQEANDIWYRELTIVLHFAKDTWRKKVLNIGMRQKQGLDEDERIPCYNDDGTKVTEPVPLTDQGYMLQDPTPETITYCEFDIYPEKPFSVLPLS